MKRRVFLPLALLLAAPLRAEVLVVTLLGTGAPAPQIERFGPAVLVEAGAQKLLFDAGRGAAQRVYQLYLPFPEVNKVFITHLHYDHLVGLPDLLMSGWVFRRERPLEVWGPTGVGAHLEHLVAAYEVDIRARLQRTGLAPQGIAYKARKVAEGVVHEAGDLKVTAFRVDHGDLEAWGYRVDYAGRSAVISGDTRYSGNLVKHARGADLLIHEIAGASERLRRRNPRLEKVLAYHASPQDVARVLAEASPRLAVLTHVLAFGVGEDELLAAASQGHRTEVVVGRDLAAFDIGSTIRRYSRKQ